MEKKRRQINKTWLLRDVGSSGGSVEGFVAGESPIPED